MELEKTNNFGSIRTPVGIIRVVETNNKISMVDWTNKIEKSSSPLICSTLIKIKKYFEKKININSVPIKLNFSNIQIEILNKISRIPFGATLSYGLLAKQLNTHARVVGKVCSINPLPLIIPCHRVLTSQNKLGGYSCGKGLETKLWLLNHENIKLN